MDIGLAHLESLDPDLLTVCALLGFSLALVVLEPVAGRRDYRRFLREEAQHGEAARVRFYRRWVLHGCATAVAALALVAALPGVALSDLGLRLPDLSALAPSGAREDGPVAGLVAGASLGLILALVVGVGIGVVRARRTPDTRDAEIASAHSTADERLAHLGPMLPRTGPGRRGWAALSLSAGITEEITYRGLLLLTLAVALPAGTPPPVLVALSALLFGAAHWYQGWQGIVGTSVLGALLAVIYLATGSLIVPMALHTLIDLRVLLVPVPASLTGQASAPHGPGH